MAGGGASRWRVVTAHTKRLPSGSLHEPEGWRWESLCGSAEADPDWWQSNRVADQTQARRWCAVCPVRELCLRAIMHTEGDMGSQGRKGIFAGFDGLQRWRMSKGGDPGLPRKKGEP